MSAAAVEVADLGVVRDGRRILEAVSFSVPRGSVTAIIGPNGAGKSTLLGAMLGLIPYSGTVRFNGNGQAPKIGYVPQRLEFDRAAPISVLDFLVMSRQRLPLWFGVGRSVRQRALAALHHVQADQLAGSRLGRLSGGELQRVQLALALQDDPDIVLLDEPISGVDMNGEQRFCDMLENIQLEQRTPRLTVVMVSHDLTVVSRHANQVVCLKGRVQFCGKPATVLTQDNLVSAYGPHMGVCRHVLEDPAPPPGLLVPLEPLAAQRAATP